MESIKLYILESYNELVNKVTWPKWPILLQNTNAVIVGSIIFALIIFVMDIVSNYAMDIVYSIGA